MHITAATTGFAAKSASQVPNNSNHSRLDLSVTQRSFPLKLIVLEDQNCSNIKDVVQIKKFLAERVKQRLYNVLVHFRPPWGLLARWRYLLLFLGYRLVKDCDAPDHPARCEACPAGQYRDEINYATQCRGCSVCKGRTTWLPLTSAIDSSTIWL